MDYKGAVHPSKTTATRVKTGEANLPEALQESTRWATPRQFMYKDSTQDRGKGNLGEKVGGQLNPMWVEWLMGLPIGWTALKPLATESYRQWWRDFLEHSGNGSESATDGLQGP